MIDFSIDSQVALELEKRRFENPARCSFWGTLGM